MRKINVTLLAFCLFSKSYAQKMFYTTYEQNNSFLHVVDLDTKQEIEKIAVFPEDTIKKIIVQKNILYLTGRDSLYTLEYPAMDLLGLPIRKSAYIGNIINFTLLGHFALVHKVFFTQLVNSTSIWRNEDYTLVYIDSIFNRKYIIKPDLDINRPLESLAIDDTLFTLNQRPITSTKDEDSYNIGYRQLKNYPTNSPYYFAPHIFTWAYVFPIQDYQRLPFSFAMINNTSFFTILGKERSYFYNNIFYQRNSPYAKIYKFDDKIPLYSTDLPDDIGPLVKNFEGVFENNIIYSLSDANVLYRITDNETEQKFEIDSLTSFKTPVLDIKSDKNDMVFVLRKDTISNLETDLVIKQNISAFTISSHAGIVDAVESPVEVQNNKEVFDLKSLMESEIKILAISDFSGRVLGNNVQPKDLGALNLATGVYIIKTESGKTTRLWID